MVVGWGFGSPELTLYTYRALESILHVYPGAHVKIITVGKEEEQSSSHAERQEPDEGGREGGRES